MAQWQGFACLAVVAASVAASLVAIIRRRTTNRRPPRAGGTAAAAAAPWASCWSRVPPAWLLAFRATAAAALAAVLAWDLRTYDASIMLYYTEWTLVLEIGYFSAATGCSAYGCLATHRRSRGADDDPESTERLLCRSGGGADEQEQQPDTKPYGDDDAWEGPDGAGRVLGLLMQIGYQVTAGAVVLTDAVFWGVIVPFISSAHFSLNAVMVCIHSLNLVFLLSETALNTLAFPWFRMAYFVLWTCLYVIVQWIAHLCGLTWWPYPFLSPTASSAPLWYLAMALLHFPCYLVYWLIVRAKSYCLVRMQAANRS